MPELDADGKPIVPADDKGGKPADKETPPNHDGKDKKGGDDKDMVPSYRVKEEADKRREAEAKLSEYQKKEADEAEAKRKADEAEALKKGEHEKVIKDKDTEIESYKAKEKAREEKNSKIQAMVDARLTDFEKKYGKEALENAKTIIGSDDPRVILDKLESVEKIIGKKEPPKGGSDDQKGDEGGSQGLKFYQDKLAKGEKLNALEEQEYFKLLDKMDE